MLLSLFLRLYTHCYGLSYYHATFGGAGGGAAPWAEPGRIRGPRREKAQDPFVTTAIDKQRWN